MDTFRTSLNCKSYRQCKLSVRYLKHIQKAQAVKPLTNMFYSLFDSPCNNNNDDDDDDGDDDDDNTR